MLIKRKQKISFQCETTRANRKWNLSWRFLLRSFRPTHSWRQWQWISEVFINVTFITSRFFDGPSHQNKTMITAYLQLFTEDVLHNQFSLFFFNIFVLKTSYVNTHSKHWMHLHNLLPAMPIIQGSWVATVNNPSSTLHKLAKVLKRILSFA